MADDADPVDPQQHRPTGVLRIELGVQGQQGRPEHSRCFPGRLGGVERTEEIGNDGLQRTLEGLECHISGESVSDDDIGFVSHEVTTLDVADESGTGVADP